MKVRMLFLSCKRHHTVVMAILAMLGLFRLWPYHPKHDVVSSHHLLRVKDSAADNNKEEMVKAQYKVPKADLKETQEPPITSRLSSSPITKPTTMQNTHDAIIHSSTSNSKAPDNNHNPLSSEFITSDNIMTANKSTTLQIDWLSVGSKTRPDLSQAHERLYGSTSRYIRHLLTANEDDDADLSCRKVLTVNDTLAIADFCQVRKKDANLPDGAKWVISDQFRYMLLNVTRHPVGWLCAQRRFALALVKVLRQYQASGKTLSDTNRSLIMPDYLMIVDDDTYYNLPKFVKFLEGKNPEEDFMIPGVSYWLSFKPRFRIYHGGYGLTMSRGAIHNALQPIYCHHDRTTPKNTTPAVPDEHLFCPRLRENWMGEYHVFRNGMTLMDLVHAYVTTWEPFSNFQNWTTGFCFHGDWVLTYFLAYAYRVGTMHQPYCKFFCKEWKANACLPNSHICHHISAEIMEERAKTWLTTA